MKQHVYKITSTIGGDICVRLIAAPNRARAVAHAAATAFTAQRADALEVSDLIAEGVTVERIAEPVNGTPVLAQQQAEAA